MTTGVQTYLCLGQTNMLLLEEELAVEVADIYGVQVNLEGGGEQHQITTGTKREMGGNTFTTVLRWPPIIIE